MLEEKNAEVEHYRNRMERMQREYEERLHGTATELQRKCGHSFPVQASCQGPLTCVTVNKLQEHMHAFQNGETLRVNPIESRIWHDLCAAYMRIWHL